MQTHAGLRVLVTAAASGIGAAIARAFVGAGARVHICDVDEGALKDALGAGPRMTGTLADVSDPEAVDALFDAVRAALGGLDVLVNNAGSEAFTFRSDTARLWQIGGESPLRRLPPSPERDGRPGVRRWQ